MLLFQRKTQKLLRRHTDEEARGDDKVDNPTYAKEGVEEISSTGIQEQTAVVHWDNVSYDINIKKEERRLLDSVEGWVRPGTMTCLMVRDST